MYRYVRATGIKELKYLELLQIEKEMQ